ncbi:MAG: hypothetical protein PVF04_04095, partial [Anaerolineae bacterium]
MKQWFESPRVLKLAEGTRCSSANTNGFTPQGVDEWLHCPSVASEPEGARSRRTDRLAPVRQGLDQWPYGRFSYPPES